MDGGRAGAQSRADDPALEPQPGYPFSLALELEYSLGGDGLRVQTVATNVGGEAAPYGSGAHPYLRAGSATVDSATLRIPARTVLHSNDRGLPVGGEQVEGTELDFRRTEADRRHGSGPRFHRSRAR